jgi:hypothetical protein
MHFPISISIGIPTLLFRLIHRGRSALQLVISGRKGFRVAFPVISCLFSIMAWFHLFIFPLTFSGSFNVLKALVCHACFFVFMAFSTWFYGGHLFLAGGIRGSEFSHTCLKGFVLDSPIDFVFFSIPPFATRLIYIHSVTSRPFHFILWGCNGTELVE